MSAEFCCMVLVDSAKTDGFRVSNLALDSLQIVGFYWRAILHDALKPSRLSIFQFRDSWLSQPVTRYCWHS